MARPGDELVDPSGLRLVFVETLSSSAGAAFSLDWFVPRGGRLVALPHVHPYDTEVFDLFGVGRHVYERSAPYTYAVPPGALHVHPANAGDTVLHVRQTVRPDPPNPQLVEGVERFFETMFAIAQRGGMLPGGVIANPLQSALTLSELLLPFSYLPWLPHGAQETLIGGLGRHAKRLGYQAHVEPERDPRDAGADAGPSPSITIA
jgi:hypothetical protein